MRFLGAILMSVAVCSTVLVGQTDRNLEREKATASQTRRRVALVIGNGAYQKAKSLPNPANDAADMAKALKELGFEVLSGTDLNKRQMQDLIRAFGTRLGPGDIGLFYYAGHGIQVNGENYLVPVDAEIPQEDEVPYATVPISLVLTKMATAKNNLNLIILDACRNNPFARDWTGYRDVENNDGLAKISPPTGTLVLYSTEPGKVASDGAGRNGLFTESLLTQMKKPNLEFEAMVKFLAKDVKTKSGNKQSPWKEGLYDGDFYFVRTDTETQSGSSPNTQSAINILPFFPIPEKNVKRSEQIVKLGEELRARDECPLAILNYTDALRLNPDSDYAFSRRGECYRMLGNYNNAIQDLNEAIRRNPRNDYAYASRAVSFWGNGQLDLVLKDLDASIELNENSYFALFMRGDFQQKNGDCGKAVDDLTRALLLSPDNQQAYLARGAAYSCHSDFEKAISDVNHVLKLDPNSVEALKQRARLYFFKRDPQKSISDYGRLVELNPEESEEYLFFRGLGFTQTGAFDSAANEFTKVINLSGDMKLEGYIFRGFAFAAAGNKTSSKADLTTAIELAKEPTDLVMAYTYRSLSYLIENETKKALSDVEKAFVIKIDDKETEAAIKPFLFLVRSGVNLEREVRISPGRHQLGD